MRQEEIDKPRKHKESHYHHHRKNDENCENFQDRHQHSHQEVQCKKKLKTDDYNEKTKSKFKIKRNEGHSSQKNLALEKGSNNLQNTDSNTDSSDVCNNTNNELKQKRKRNHRNESFEELSDRKKQIELELQALDAEEAAHAQKRKKIRNHTHHQGSQGKPVQIKQEPSSDNEYGDQVRKIRSEMHPVTHKQKSASDDDNQRNRRTKSDSKIHAVKIKQEPADDYDRNNRRTNLGHRSHSVKVKEERNNDNRGHRRTEANRMANPVRVKQEYNDRSPHSHRPHSNNKRRNATADAENMEWGRPEQEKPSKKEVKEKEKPNFESSGKLAEDTNTFNGIVIKYNEPAEARKPRRRWRLYPFKGNNALPFIPIHRQSAYLLGRSRLIADIPIDHPSCSKQHAVLQFRLTPYTREDGTKGRNVRPYIIDLESSNGTFVNNKPIDPRRYMELFEKDVLKFGFSSRVYVILHEESKSELDDDEDDGAVIEESPS